MVRWIVALALGLGFARQARAGGEALSVAAAANLKPAMEELARAFEANRPGARVRATFGGSGAFFAQMREGAPFDVFFSADREYPKQLVDAGLADARDEQVYAVGRLALWVPKGSALDVERGGLAALAGKAVKKVAIANPAVAPYGRAAVEALRRAGVYEAVTPKLVFGQNVSQAARFAEGGAADAALLPLSLARLPALASRGRAVALPASSHPAIEQSAVVLKRSKKGELARAFVAFVRGDEGRAILERHGYETP